MPAIKLNQRRVDALKPRKSAYDVRDRDLKGFGLRVWPSGKKRYFVHSQHGGRRVWKTIASAESTSAGEARAWAATMLATIRRGGDAPASPEEAVFEAVADEVFTRYARNWKPGTLKVNRNYYRNHILPRFKGRPIAGIDSRDVRQWFASLHAKPAAADRSAPILSVIMRQAEIYGYRPDRLCTWLRFDQHAVGKGFCIGGEAEERAESSVAGFAAVEAKDELIEIGLQMLATQPVPSRGRA